MSPLMLRAAVFVGVLAAIAGLAWVLLSVGDASTDETASTNEPATTIDRKRHRAQPDVPTEPPPMPIFASPPKTDDARARFEVPGHEDVKYRDWKQIAGVVADLGEVMREDARRSPGVQPDPKAMDRRKAVMEKFQRLALAPVAGVDPPPPPTPIGHPAFTSNAVAALLDRAKLPLGAEQTARVRALVLSVAPTIDRLGGKPYTDLGENEFALDRELERYETLRRYWDSVYAILTPEQGEAVAPSEYRGRPRLDFFASGTLANPLPYREVPELVDKVTGQLEELFEITEKHAELRSLVEFWASSYPSESFDALERSGFLRTSRAATALRSMADLYHRIVENLALSPETAEKVRRSMVVDMPMAR